MRARHRIVVAFALALSLFSGRFMLARALRGPRHAPPVRAAVDSTAWSADAARRLAESLAHEISSAPGGLALEISTARRECNAVADAVSRHASIDPKTARSSMTLGHGLLAGVHLQRADAAWRARDLGRSGREFEAAIEELDQAASWRGGALEIARTAPEDARSLARRLEAGDPGVLAQDFEGSEAALSCALWEVAPAAARAAGAAACATRG